MARSVCPSNFCACALSCSVMGLICVGFPARVYPAALLARLKTASFVFSLFMYVVCILRIWRNPFNWKAVSFAAMSELICRDSNPYQFCFDDGVPNLNFESDRTLVVYPWPGGPSHSLLDLCF